MNEKTKIFLCMTLIVVLSISIVIVSAIESKTAIKKRDAYWSGIMNTNCVCPKLGINVPEGYNYWKEVYQATKGG
jgi:hypothetical protein